MQVSTSPKTYFPVHSLNESKFDNNSQTIANFENKLIDITALNNIFFVKSVENLSKAINLITDTKEIESYQRDINKIEKIYTDVVQEMTNKGERINPLLGNNLRRNIEGVFDGKASNYDPNKTFHYLQCYEQTDRVIKRLKEQKDTFENNWSFDDVSNYPDWKYTHTWGRATPNNDKIPFIYFDPFWNKIKESTCQCESRDSCAPCKP